MGKLTPAEENVAIFTANRALFEEVRLHNLAVIVRRLKGGDYAAPENRYRNAWNEILQAQREAA